MNDWQKERGGRIDVTRQPDAPMSSDDRIDQAIAESFPASDPPSWTTGLERDVPEDRDGRAENEEDHAERR